MVLVEPVDVEVSPRGVYVSGLALSGTGGDIQATVALGASNGRVRTSLHGFDPMPWIARFTKSDVSCRRVDLDLDASWSASEVLAHAKGRAEMLQVGVGAPATDVEIDCTLKDKRAVIERLSVSAIVIAPGANPLEPGALDSINPAQSINEDPLVFSGEFPLDLRGEELLPDGLIRLNGAIEMRDLGRAARALGTDPSKVAGRLRAELDLSGTWSQPRGKVVLTASDLSWTPKTSDQIFGPCSIRGELDLDHDLSIRSLTLDLPAGVRAECSGRVSGPFDLRDALRAGAETWRTSPLDLSVRVEAENLALLTVMIPSLRRLGGKLGGNVQVKGSLTEPRYTGDLELTDGEVRTTSALPSLSGITAKLVLEGDRVRLEALHGEMGGAPFSLSGTVSPFGTEALVDLELVGEHLLLYRASGLRIRAGAKLTIKGPLRAMEVRGDLALDDSRFTRDFDFLSAFGRQSSGPPLFSRPLFELPPPFASATFDVKVGSKKAFVIQNNLINGGVRPELRIVGTGALPILRGTIIIDPTRITLPSGRITARSGALEFLPSAPFAPRIDALADARLQGYDIKLHLTGTIEVPEVELTSVPPLPHEDLLLLVLTGTLPRADQKSPTGVRAAKSVAVYLASDAISSWFRSPDSDAKDDGDILEVQSGRDVTETGAETTTARLRVWKGIFSDNSSLYITGERDIYDFYNFGVRLLFRFP